MTVPKGSAQYDKPVWVDYDWSYKKPSYAEWERYEGRYAQ